MLMTGLEFEEALEGAVALIDDTVDVDVDVDIDVVLLFASEEEFD